MISCNGLFLRSIAAATPWQVIFSRQISFVGATLVVLLFLHHSKFFFLFLQTGWVGLLGGVLLSLANTCLILSISLTTVANTLFILSACPLITAVLAWVFLKERIESMTIIAILVSMGGTAPLGAP